MSLSSAIDPILFNRYLADCENYLKEKKEDAPPSDKHKNVLPAATNKTSKITDLNWSDDDSTMKKTVTGSKPKASNVDHEQEGGLNPFLDTAISECDNIQPEIFIISDTSSGSMEVKNGIKSHSSFFNFGILDAELVVGGFPEEDAPIHQTPSSDFSSDYLEYKILKGFDSSEDCTFEDNFVNEEQQQPDQEVPVLTSSDEISPEVVLKVIQGFEELHVEESSVVDDKSLIELEIEALDTARDGKSSQSSTSIQKPATSGSFEALSSFESTLEGDDDDDDDHGKDFDGPVTINEMLASLPYDAPVFYNKFPPHNRDALAVLPKLSTDLNFKNQKIFLTEINSPAHFWFQMVENHELWIESMQKRINMTYRRYKSRDLRISSQNYQVGLLVAGYHPVFKEWYRAQINQVKKRTVHLFFIDYGTHVFIKKKYVKYLVNEFMEYPKACERGRIHGLMPVDGKQNYSVAEMDLFISKLTNEHFEADLRHYDEEEDVYEMKIKLSTEDQDVAEWTVDEKICEKVPEDLYFATLLTHKMLETGTHPSFEVMLHNQQQKNLPA